MWVKSVDLNNPVVKVGFTSMRWCALKLHAVDAMITAAEITDGLDQAQAHVEAYTPAQWALVLEHRL